MEMEIGAAAYDFNGNAPSTSRRLAADFTDEPDWTPVASSATPSAALAQAASLLETETFSKAFSYDALNRTTSATMPDLSELRPTFNVAGLLEAVHTPIRGATDGNGAPVWTPFVAGIVYDEKGRRTRIDYGNGTFTEYFYDPLSFRLTRLRTTRSGDGAKLQDLFYFYDPVGNITTIRDDAQQDVFFAGQQVTPTQELAYDPIYRLISATGREHAGGVGDIQRDANDLPLWNLPHPNDAQALRTYTEMYDYDEVGNIREMFHNAGNGSPGTWRRKYAYGANPFGAGAPAVPASNRLHSTSLPGDQEAGPFSAAYTHDANGNMVAMPHLAEIAYTHADQMKRADLGGGGTAYYTYDAAGERVRKVIQRIGTTREERIYLGGWEIYRKRQGAGGDVVLERETLHVMDDARRIAMVETKTVDADVQGPLLIVPRTRYQYGNHLDSAHLECDTAGLVVSYEEYHPYGTPAYRSARGGVEVSEKRYRYTGKERDEETGFQYHSARYLAPWLGRWTKADPAGMVSDTNHFAYCRGSPITWMDPSGTQEIKPFDPQEGNGFVKWLLYDENASWFKKAVTDDKNLKRAQDACVLVAAATGGAALALAAAPAAAALGLGQIGAGATAGAMTAMFTHGAIGALEERPVDAAALAKDTAAGGIYGALAAGAVKVGQKLGEIAAKTPPKPAVPPTPKPPTAPQAPAAKGPPAQSPAQTPVKSVTVARATDGESGALLSESSLTSRQTAIHRQLQQFGATGWFPKRGVSMSDLRAMSRVTGDEYSMFTLGGRRFVVRAYGNEVRVPLQMAVALRAGRYGRWSGHVHPLGYSTSPSVIDRSSLPLGQTRSAIWGAEGGKPYVFHQTPHADARFQSETARAEMRKFYEGQ